MQEHYLTFRILVFLKEIGVTRRINFFVSHAEGRMRQFEPSPQMLCSQNFFQNRAQDLSEIKMILEDEKSCSVLQACIDYRMHRIPIPHDLFSENDQYFVDELFSVEDGEQFVDGGAYTGDTTQQFIDLARKKKIDDYKVIAFEPSKKYYEMICRYFKRNSKVMPINKGLSGKTETIYFRECGASSKIVNSESGATEIIQTTTIDEMVECKDATFIKMDIEGAEMEALHGARDTILKNKPKLAICIYHSDDDMIRIIKYIHELVPEYHLYVRHHSKSEVETVLYAKI